jgi:hypothetical protein
MHAVWQQLYLATADERCLPEAARTRIAAALERGWGGLELRHAFGEFWFVLEWGEPGWFAANAGRVWPEGDGQADANVRRAFLYGYLYHGYRGGRQWSRSVLRALVPMFREGVRDLARDRPLYFDEHQFVEPFVHRLALGWLHDVEGFGIDGLLGEFLAAAPDQERARFVRLLGRLYRVTAAGDAVDFESTTRKRDELWRRRAAELGARLPPAERSEELSAFCSWMRHFPRRLRDIEDRVGVSIRHLAGGQGAITDLLEALAARGESEPPPAARILEQLVDRLIGEQELQWGWHRDAFGNALDAICRGARPHLRTQVRRIVDRLMRAGVADLTAKLDGCAVRRSVPRPPPTVIGSTMAED